MQAGCSAHTQGRRLPSHFCPPRGGSRKCESKKKLESIHNSSGWEGQPPSGGADSWESRRIPPYAFSLFFFLLGSFCPSLSLFFIYLLILGFSFVSSFYLFLLSLFLLFSPPCFFFLLSVSFSFAMLWVTVPHNSPGTRLRLFEDYCGEVFASWDPYRRNVVRGVGSP